MTDAVSVYVFGAGDGLVKVGVSGDTKARAAQLRAMLPGGRMIYERSADNLRSRRAERLAHVQLSTHCIGGEWFAVDADTAIMAVDGAIDVASAMRIKTSTPRPPSGLHSWVKTCRIVMDWTVKEFAARAGVSPPTITKAETADGSMTCAVADKLLRALFAVGWTIEQTIPGVISEGLVLHAPKGHCVSISGGVPLFSREVSASRLRDTPKGGEP